MLFSTEGEREREKVKWIKSCENQKWNLSTQDSQSLKKRRKEREERRKLLPALFGRVRGTVGALSRTRGEASCGGEYREHDRLNFARDKTQVSSSFEMLAWIKMVGRFKKSASKFDLSHLVWPLELGSQRSRLGWEITGPLHMELAVAFGSEL